MARHDIRDWQATLTEEQRRECARVAGKASAEVKRKHRLFKDILQDVLAAPLPDGDALAPLLEAVGLEANHENAIMLASALRAKLGDIEAARFVRDTVGEKPTEAFNLGLSAGPIKAMELDKLSDAELARLADEADAASD